MLVRKLLAADGLQSDTPALKICGQSGLNFDHRSR